MQLRTKSQQIWDDVRTCLNIASNLESYLIYPHREDYRGQIDAEVKTSAEATFINVCNRLDILLDRMAEYKAEDKLGKLIVKSIEAETGAEQAREMALRTASRPSVLYRPGIVRHPNGVSWCAIYGDPNEMEHCVIGVGASLEEAMLDFDKEFSAKVGPAKKKNPKKDGPKK